MAEIGVSPNENTERCKTRQNPSLSLVGILTGRSRLLQKAASQTRCDWTMYFCQLGLRKLGYAEDADVQLVHAVSPNPMVKERISRVLIGFYTFVRFV